MSRCRTPTPSALALLAVALLPAVAAAPSGSAAGAPATPRVMQIPLVRGLTAHNADMHSVSRRQAGPSSIGLGDAYDVTYQVLVQVGPVQLPLVLDTGSSDTLVVSDACTSANCISSVGDTRSLFPMGNLTVVQDVSVRLSYGDSSTRTYATGPVGSSTLGVAGHTLTDQYFAAINDTNTNLADTGSAGIFGLGFPLSSIVLANYFKAKFPDLTAAKRSPAPPSLSPRQSFSDLLSILPSAAPPIPRAIFENKLAEPMIAITLQRDTVDVGGNAGMLTLGGLPDTVDSKSLTWSDVRLYDREQANFPASFGDTHYPMAWEIMIDDVYLDGQRLPRTNLTPSSIDMSALLDTGNSWVRGPADVVEIVRRNILAPGSAPGSVIPSFYDCTPHTLAFEIGGKMFPIDPRDLISPDSSDIQFRASEQTTRCSLNLAVKADLPKEGEGGFLYSWKLGAPFLRSVLAAYYYGDLIDPSADRPRIGLLSTVPADATDAMNRAIAEARVSGGVFPMISESAPSGTYRVQATDSHGVPQAPSYSAPNRPNPSDSAARTLSLSTMLWTSLVCLVACAALR